MKTIEQKAKAYDEALNIAKETYETQPVYRAWLEKMFPQLRESDEEEIREDIIGGLMWQRDNLKSEGPHDNNLILPGFCLTVGKHLSYLEKQKEQKPNIEICPHSIKSKSYKENGYPIENCDYGLEIAFDILEKTFGEVRGYQTYDGIKEHQTAIEAVRKAKEQKPAEWSEDYREEDIQTRFAFYTYKDDPSILYLSNVFVEEASRNHGFGTRILKAAEKAAEAIGAITICLKVKQDSPANAWYRKRGYGYVAFEDGYDWLEKNLEYLKPAQPAKWSEEEEKMLARIIEDTISYLNGGMCFNNSIEELKYRSNLAHKLKSLRPSWKPSEQEKGALRTAISILTEERNFPKAAAHLQAILDAFDGKEARKEWKPSEEQMKGLKFFLDFHRPQRNAGTTNWREYDAVESLYGQLEKLKP